MSVDTRTSSTTLRALQVSAVLAVLSVAWQFVTAGQLFPEGGPKDLHSGGAIVLHILTGVVAIVAWLHRRNTSGPVWPTVLGAVVFVLSFVQAYTGGYDTLWIHVPGAMVLTVGSVWVAVWAFSSRT